MVRYIYWEKFVVKSDLKRTYDLVSGGRFKKIIGCYQSPGCHAVVVLRFGQWLKKRNILIGLF